MAPGGGSSPPVTGTQTNDVLSETRGISRGDQPSTCTFCPTVCPTMPLRAPERLCRGQCDSQGRNRLNGLSV